MHTMEKQSVWASLDPFYETGPLMGRKVANAAFLRALLRLDPFDAYHFFPMSQPMLENLEHTLSLRHPDLMAQGRVVLHYRRELPRRLRELDYYCFHQSDCINYQPHLARVRNLCSREIFPITGGIHSLSLAGYMDKFLAHLWPGTTSRDAIVATSGPGAGAVQAFFRHGRQGLGLEEARYPAPEVRTIPLGVDVEGMRPATAEDRAGLRRSLDIPEQATAFLCFGRLEHHSKMDVLPLFRAFMRMFMDGVRRERVVLVLAGWAEEDDPFPSELETVARGFGLDMRLFLRPDRERKTALFQAADAFVSIADNPQETFGLTILEAGAFGLPVVASDYDGYKDLVRDGETGFRVPTLGPKDTRRIDAMSRLLFDNQYHLPLAQRLAVDVAALADRLTRLLADPDQTRSMGMTGREQALKFSWRECALRHVQLWDALWHRPVPDREALRHILHPRQVPYADVFSGYPSGALAAETMLQTSRTGQAAYRGVDNPVIYEGLGEIIREDAFRAMLYKARNPVSTQRLMAFLLEQGKALDSEQAEALVLWGLKHDFLELSEAWKPEDDVEIEA
jgi:glycosyltransferase involved in cell wall biosynthesis